MQEFLKNRRSTKVKHLTEPGPNPEQLQNILTVATRVPDHGKLSPFYFIIFEGNARSDFGEHLKNAWVKDYPQATEEQLDYEKNRFMRAPLVIAVISRIREATIPAWEQMMSAGACCYNLCLSANTHGYATNWLSEWYSYNSDIHQHLGLEEGIDNIVGFIYIGTATELQEDRPRPDLDSITNYWDLKKTPDKKGDIYNKVGVGRPVNGFKISQPPN